MTTKIIVVGNHSDDVVQRFESLPHSDVVFASRADDISARDLAEAELFVGSMTPELLEKMPKLRFVQLYSAGAVGHSWLPERVTLANAYGAYGDSMAEHMITTTLMAMKRMPEYLRMQERQDWELLTNIQSFEGAHVLSVGMGAIGTSYLKKASALGATCYGVRRTIHDKPDFVRELVTTEGMDRLLPQMDVVALSLPGTAATAGMFDERRLLLMKESAILVNVGRGISVVTDDLVRVMNNNHLWAACLDVMDPEPLPAGHPLWTTPRVYITPHVSGGFRAGVNYKRVMDLVLQNLALVLDGKPPVHAVNRTLGY